MDSKDFLTLFDFVWLTQLCTNFVLVNWNKDKELIKTDKFGGYRDRPQPRLNKRCQNQYQWSTHVHRQVPYKNLKQLSTIYMAILGNYDAEITA